MGRRARAYFYIILGMIFALLFLTAVPLPGGIEDSRNTFVQHITDVAKFHLTDPTSGDLDDNHGQTLEPLIVELDGNYGQTLEPPIVELDKTNGQTLESTTVELGNDHEKTIASVKSRYAYATFLTHDEDKEDEELEHDNYLTAVRILAYQLLHAPETRTHRDIPFLVLVNKDVSEAKRERLRRDGAIIWEPEPVDSGWIQTPIKHWNSVMAKLRLWELTQFERICFLDADTTLTANIDDVFDDPAVALQTTGSDQTAVKDDEALLPKQYAFAASVEMSPVHHFPPTEEGHDWPNKDYLNAGFMVIAPDLDVLNYYFGLFNTPDRFDPLLPEQNMFNYAHRRDGNMPWQRLDPAWNMHFPSVEDLEGGAKSLHDHWWKAYNADLAPYMRSWRYRMKGFSEARDEFLGTRGP